MFRSCPKSIFSLIKKKKKWHRVFGMAFGCLSPWNVNYAKSNEAINSDSEVNRRRDMFSDIVYVYIRKGVMLDRSHMTLLLNNEFMSNRKNMKPRRTFWKTSHELKSFKNSMFEVLPGRMLFEMRHVVSFLLLVMTHNNCWRSRIWIRFRIQIICYFDDIKPLSGAEC